MDLSNRPKPASLFGASAVPDEVVLTRDRASLRLVWEGVVAASLPADDLRLLCRCAWCTRDRIQARFPERFEGVAIAHVERKGDYALHITFSDGHDRGIFPWAYLRDIADDILLPSRPEQPNEGQRPASRIERSR